MRIWLAVFTIFILLWRMQAVDNTTTTCKILSENECQGICVPRDGGAELFSCGDWWSNEKCCNGSTVQQLATATYFECYCESKFCFLHL